LRKSRRRYLLFTMHADRQPISAKHLSTALWRSLLSLYGEILAADSRLYLLNFEEATGIGVLQCNASSLQFVITAAAVIDEIEGVHVSFEPKKTSGTIKGLNHPVRKHV
jgi:RNase P/RNase MRP subunit POP5